MNTEKKYRILCVDDFKRNLTLLEAFLSKQGYDLVFAETGEDALKIVDQGGIDLILLDVLMPGMSGIEVLKQLRSVKKTSLIPVIILTALSEVEDRIEGIKAGCDDYISKPFSQGELIVRVKSLLKMKDMREELENNFKQLKELEVLKENLTAMIVHDMGNPLNEIILQLSFLETELKDKLNDEQKYSMGSAIMASHYIKEMIKDVIDVTRLEEEKLKPEYEEFDMMGVVQEVIDGIQMKAKKFEMNLSCEILGTAAVVRADRNLIKRVIANLVQNAIKFSNRGGDIVVKINYEQFERNVLVQVKDSGRGIQKENLDKIFDKFFQVQHSDSKHGTGLGLTFCRLAVEAHNGKIWVESEVSKGSIFNFTIPINIPQKS